MTGIGHNNGPTMERGGGWRRYAWKRARTELLPKMPIEIVRRRVKRARELGLDYKAYAGIRAATGRDVIALLFSDNALRIMKDARIAPDREAYLQNIRGADKLALVHAPFLVNDVALANPTLDRLGRAPVIADGWSDIRQRVLELKGNLPADGVVVVGETWLERQWSEAGRLAGYLPADTYFSSVSQPLPKP